MKEYSINTITYYPTHISVDRNHDFIKSHIAKYSDNPSLYNKIVATYSKGFSRISGFNLDNLFISLTSSDSIFFRFTSVKINMEFKLEIFIDYDECDDSDIESTLHIYKNGIKEKSLFGSVDYLLDLITITMGTTYETIRTEENYRLYNPNMDKSFSQEGLSPSFITKPKPNSYSYGKFGQFALSR